MHSPPWTTMGEAETRWRAMRPSSPIAHRRWTNTSYLIGSSWATGAATMAGLPGQLTEYFRYLAWACCSHYECRAPLGILSDDHVSVAVDRALVAGRHDDGGERRFDDRRAADDGARAEASVVVDGGVQEAAVEVGLARRLAGLLRIGAGLLLLGEHRLGDRTD